MFALGHKRTFAPAKTACPLYPRKRHQMRHGEMSALGQKRTSDFVVTRSFSTDRAVAAATEVDRNFVDLAGEFERRLVSEINRRANILANVQSFAN